MNALDDGPVDLAAVQADEALLSVLPFAVRGGDRTTQGLMTLRRVVHSKPFPSLVDVDTAATVIAAARPRRSWGAWVAGAVRRWTGGGR